MSESPINLEVFDLRGQGISFEDIADRLGISIKEAKSQIARRKKSGFGKQVLHRSHNERMEIQRNEQGDNYYD